MTQSKIFNLEGYVSLSDDEAVKISGGKLPPVPDRQSSRFLPGSVGDASVARQIF
jgi:hypothetical protein